MVSPLAVAGIGAAGSVLGGLLGSRGPKMKQLPTMNKAQQGLMNSLISKLQSGGMHGNVPAYDTGVNYLQNLYSERPEIYNRLAAPYLRQFNEEIVPSIGERFSAMGGGSPRGGGQQSSAFALAQMQAAKALQESLAGQFEQTRLGALGPLLNYSQVPYNQAIGALGQRPFDYTSQTGAMQGLGQGLSQFGGMMGSTGLYSYLTGAANAGGVGAPTPSNTSYLYDPGRSNFASQNRPMSNYYNKYFP